MEVNSLDNECISCVDCVFYDDNQFCEYCNLNKKHDG